MIECPVDGWRAVLGSGALELCISSLKRYRAAVINRDVIIGMPGDGAPLVAEEGDLWFHTDGTFLTPPPRWLIVQVREAEGEGEIEVLNLKRFADHLPQGPVWFGKDGRGIRAQIVERNGVDTILRYRRDYMLKLEGGPEPSLVHDLVSGWAEKSAEPVNWLAPNDCLLLDNWSVLHRRRVFRGRRVVRR